MKHFLLGVTAFAIITGIVLSIEFVLDDMLQVGKETVTTLIMVGALLFIAKPFGELTASVFKLNK